MSDDADYWRTEALRWREKARDYRDVARAMNTRMAAVGDYARVPDTDEARATLDRMARGNGGRRAITLDGEPQDWAWDFPNDKAGAKAFARDLRTIGLDVWEAAGGLVGLGPLSIPPRDGEACWRRCPCCGDWWCVRHEQHTAGCPCPPVEEWEGDPYL